MSIKSSCESPSGERCVCIRADAAQTARRAAPARQFRDQDGRGIAHDNHIHLALPIDDEADLTPERT